MAYDTCTYRVTEGHADQQGQWVGVASTCTLDSVLNSFTNIPVLGLKLF